MPSRNVDELQLPPIQNDEQTVVAVLAESARLPLAELGPQVESSAAAKADLSAPFASFEGGDPQLTPIPRVWSPEAVAAARRDRPLMRLEDFRCPLRPSAPPAEAVVCFLRTYCWLVLGTVVELRERSLEWEPGSQRAAKERSGERNIESERGRQQAAQQASGLNKSAGLAGSQRAAEDGSGERSLDSERCGGQLETEAGCGKALVGASEPKRHEDTHTGDRRHSCNVEMPGLNHRAHSASRQLETEAGSALNNPVCVAEEGSRERSLESARGGLLETEARTCLLSNPLCLAECHVDGVCVGRAIRQRGLANAAAAEEALLRIAPLR
jgi:hypothetical protein